MEPIAGVLLAAGQSKRFGRQKLLEHWQGEPLIRRAARVFLSGGLAPVIAVISEDRGLDAALAGLSIRLVVNRQPELGISQSIKLGIEALPSHARAAAVGTSDQPLMTADVVERLCRSFRPGAIVVPCYGHVRGNPRVYDRRFFPELVELTGDTGGQPIAARHPEAVVEVKFPEVLGADVDTPEDWARMQQRAKKPAGPGGRRP